MRVAIRTDASVDIGSGHVMRCLALADALRAGGEDIAFVCSETEGNLCDLIRQNDFGVFRLPPQGDLRAHWQQDAERTSDVLDTIWAHTDWLLVDHYQLDARWENALRATGVKIMAIDDIADRPHDCDLLLDQNFCRNMDGRYDGLLPQHANRLLGPNYALLRQEFSQARAARSRSLMPCRSQ